MLSKFRFSFLFARRYLLSKKSHHLVNFISLISVIGIAAGTAALFVILSVFNGFEYLVLGLFNSYNPDLLVEPVRGKVFDSQAIDDSKLYQWPGVKAVVNVLEENALLKYKDKQFIARIKGVSSNYPGLAEADSILIDGKFLLKNHDRNYTVMGYGVAYSLGIRLNDYENPVEVYLPDRNAHSIQANPESFRNSSLIVSGVFSIQQEIDEKYILSSIEFIQELLESPGKLSSAEVHLKEGTDIEAFQSRLQKQLGNNFTVKNRYQQEELLYRIIKSERWAIFFILSFILIIATFNVFSSLSMLILEKRKDTRILWSMGAPLKLIRSIFINEGLLIVIMGALSGLIFGILICFLQQQFGFVKLGGETGNFLVDAYPVKMKVLDILLILITVALVGLASVVIPVKKLSTKFLKNRID